LNYVPSIGLTSISKSSSRLRDPATGQPSVPPSHRSPRWTTCSLAVTCSNRGTPPLSASSALSQRAWNTRQVAPVSWAVRVGEPYQVNTIRPAEPAASDGNAADFVAAPSFTRTGLDQVGVSLVL